MTSAQLILYKPNNLNNRSWQNRKSIVQVCKLPPVYTMLSFALLPFWACSTPKIRKRGSQFPLFFKWPRALRPKELRIITGTSLRSFTAADTQSFRTRPRTGRTTESRRAAESTRSRLVGNTSSCPRFEI